jgi:predicted DNA-binding transcriptional regulator AlpA
MSGKLLRTSEVADLLSVSVATLEKWRQRGHGPVYQRLGTRSIRYDPASIEMFKSSSTLWPEG